MTTYDPLGAEHKLLVDYQNKSHMPNVWVHFISSDPIETVPTDTNTLTVPFVPNPPTISG